MNRAFAYLNLDPVLHAGPLECIRRGSAEILEASASGVLLLDRGSGAYMLSAENEASARRMLAGLQTAALLVVHRGYGAEFAEERFGLHRRMPVRNAVYTRREPLPGTESPAEIRKLDEKFLPFVEEHYRMVPDRAYLLGRLRAGVMFGAFEGGTAEGFIGMHEEGSMGLLEVLPTFRRRGIARLLETFQVNRLLEEGCLPYAQVVTGNKASLSLHRSLGFSFSENQICWLTA